MAKDDDDDRPKKKIVHDRAGAALLPVRSCRSVSHC